jgi:ubiquinone/menaquinone biosynthesis C-methylase UbiE/DNA-binding transcriptional ArsR family regulator
VIKPISDTTTLAGQIKALGDPIRLRLLSLLADHELSVGELCRALGLAQSRVSNHLRVLREHQLLHERKMGTSTFLRLEPGAQENGERVVDRLWRAFQPELEDLPEHADDLARLRMVLDDRRRDSTNFFDDLAGDWNAIGIDFETGQARQRVVANFIPRDLTIADLGCGTGYVAQAFLGLAQRIICVDSSGGMLEEARKRLGATTNSTSVEYRQGELNELPILGDEVDGAVCAMVLHHLENAQAPLAEMFRICRPGGTAVLMELSPHKQTWMHEALGDRHLGIDPDDVAQQFRAAGFVNVSLEILSDRYQPRQEQQPDAENPGVPLYLLRGQVPHSPTG